MLTNMIFKNSNQCGTGQRYYDLSVFMQYRCMMYAVDTFDTHSSWTFCLHCVVFYQLNIQWQNVHDHIQNLKYSAHTNTRISISTNIYIFNPLIVSHCVLRSCLNYVRRSQARYKCWHMSRRNCSLYRLRIMYRRVGWEWWKLLLHRYVWELNQGHSTHSLSVMWLSKMSLNSKKL